MLLYSDSLFEKYENIKVSNNCFKECFISTNGGTFESKYYCEHSSYKLITIKNITDNGFDSSSTSYLLKEKALETFRLNKGDILLTMTGNIGRVGLVDVDNCYLNQRVLKISASSKLYLLCYLRKYKQKIIQLGKGTAQQNLSLEELNKLNVFNTRDEIADFSKYEFIFDLLLIYKIQINKLKSIKKTLLNKYFN